MVRCVMAAMNNTRRKRDVSQWRQWEVAMHCTVKCELLGLDSTAIVTWHAQPYTRRTLPTAPYYSSSIPSPSFAAPASSFPGLGPSSVIVIYGIGDKVSIIDHAGRRGAATARCHYCGGGHALRRFE